MPASVRKCASEEHRPPANGTREAVIVIHGMGEQHRGATLRDFVGVGWSEQTVFERLTGTGVMGGEAATGINRGTATGSGDGSGIATAADTVYASPAPIRDKDVQAYTIVWGETQLKTDVYELYWAPHYRSTKIGAVFAWAWPLLSRRRRTMTTTRLLGTSPAGAFTVQLFLTVLLGAAIATITGISPGAVQDWVSAHSGWTSLMLIALAATSAAVSGWCGLRAMIRSTVLALVVIVVAIVWLVTVRGWQWSTLVPGAGLTVVVAATTWIGNWLAMSIGDVARYLSKNPDSVRENDNIRGQARVLIEQLHTMTIGAGDGQPAGDRYRYSRIVVVGHSLGSVIAYDAVHSAWRACHSNVPQPRADIAPLTRTHNELAEYTADNNDRFRILTDSFHNPALSVAERSESRAASKRWIVSDLITLACPLAHSEVLLAASPADLERQFAAGELVSSVPPEPPFPGNPGPAQPATDETSGSAPTNNNLRWYERRTESGARRLYHRTLFAFTNWHNAWISHDIVGGPLPEATGDDLSRGFAGRIQNTDCGGSRWLWSMLVLYPHSSYFTISRRRGIKGPSTESLKLLRTVISRTK